MNFRIKDKLSNIMLALLFVITDFLLTLFTMGLFGAAHGLSNLSHISYSDETWHSYTLP